MKYQVIADLECFLAEKYQQETVLITPELCPETFTGDLTINGFLLARALRRNPNEIAPVVLEFLSSHQDVENAEQVKAFVNITLTRRALFAPILKEESYMTSDCLLAPEERKKILIEYSAPNTNKPQHLGHVRNNTIGMTLASLLKTVGHDVVPVNLVNDRGIHICKSMLAYQRFGEGATPESADKKGDHLVGDFYVAFDKALRQQIADLKEANPELSDKSKDDLFLQTELGQATQKMLQDWENNVPEVRELWQKMNQWVFDGFAETYKRMGIEFEHTYLESQTYKLGKDIIEDGLQRGVFSKREDGAVIIDLAKYKLDTKVVLRSDGTSVYITQDIGTTLLKQKDYQPRAMIWVVGDEQIYHFKVLFAILKELGYEWADSLYHMAYGMVELPNGKMKSREGTVVDADNLFDELHHLAKDAILQRSAEVPEDLEDRAEKIGMGALKFLLQSYNPKTTIKFDPEASISFEGDTGPYVMYAYARISSMIRKADAETLAIAADSEVLGENEERQLMTRLSMFGSTVKKAAANMDPSILTGYLLDVARAFSRFYNACPVLVAQDPIQRKTRLQLSCATKNVLKAGLEILTIQTVENM